MNLELADFFGEGASQSETTLTISKSGLPGLTARADNSAQSLLAAILAQSLSLASITFTYQGEIITDESGDPIPLTDVVNCPVAVSFWKRFFFLSGDYTTLLFSALYSSEELAIMPTQIPIVIDLSGYISLSQKGAANGVAPLGEDSRISINFIPKPTTTGWQPLVLGNSFTLPAGEQALQYRTWSDGTVELRGAITRATAPTANLTISTLPTEARPDTIRTITTWISGNVIGAIQLLSTGAINYFAGVMTNQRMHIHLVFKQG